jgi:aspartyl-tRNA(Asn)/glutamyl-tRNA(Gln) amidotransferase subunit C
MAAAEIDVKYVAHLARLALSPDEEKKLGAQLGNILGYIEKLRELDVTNVEPTAHAVPMVNVTRADEIRPSFPHDEALRNAPRRPRPPTKPWPPARPMRKNRCWAFPSPSRTSSPCAASRSIAARKFSANSFRPTAPRRRKIAGGRRDCFWPAEHGRICHGQFDGKFRLRRHAQSVGHHAHSRRFFRRFGRGRRGR